MTILRGFKIAKQDTFEKARINSANARRTPELRKAWLEQEEIREAYLKGENVKSIAKRYKINERTCYRIISL